MNQLKKSSNDLGPALTLMLLAPLLTEVLPGATRFSSIFVLPIEICVWGGGALLIRYAVRKRRLGWPGMLLLALALSLSEECIIQQTSLAPMVIHLKGEVYARAGGVNYVYLLWALIYESVFVVFLPICLVEMIFPARRQRLWISKGGFFAVIPLFLLGSFLAWFSWTRIARTKVFHVPVYTPPAIITLLSLALIAGLIFLALTRFKNNPPLSSITPPPSWVLLITGTLWATLLFGLVLLGFGIAPHFPPLAAIGGAILLFSAALFFVPKWSANPQWQHPQVFSLLFGTILGSMLISFVGFIDTGGPDLYFKIITNILAIILLLLLGGRKNLSLQNG
ncbi:MAG TPA: hypothetical protein VGM30_14180 [Puia sp.]|jgi:hypothetical protein